MLRFVQGNMFEANVEALVNTVNTVGVMGKGVALQFCRAYPEILKPYKDACESGELAIGKVFTVKLSMLDGLKYVINFPTKKDWKGKSRIEFVEDGLQSLVGEIRRLGIKSIAVPPLGCGLGGLQWPDVRHCIESVLGQLSDVEVLVYEPTGKPAASKMMTGTKKPAMSAGRAALIELVRRYLVPLMDDEVTLLELHKLMYFLRESGEVEKLSFEKGRYGPYSTNLRHVLIEIEGHYITGFGDASEEPGKILELMPGAIKEAEQFLKSQPKTQNCIEKVVDLIDGFETAYGMELLGSVHWVAKHDDMRAANSDDAIRLVHAWNDRKRETFAGAHIEVAWNRLSRTGWL